MTTQVPSCCPISATKCKFEQRFDTKAIPTETIKALADYFSESNMIEAMVTAAEKVYVGESCQHCGAFFPCTAIRPDKS